MHTWRFGWYVRFIIIMYTSIATQDRLSFLSVSYDGRLQAAQRARHDYIKKPTKVWMSWLAYLKNDVSEGNLHGWREATLIVFDMFLINMRLSDLFLDDARCKSAWTENAITIH